MHCPERDIERENLKNLYKIARKGESHTCKDVSQLDARCTSSTDGFKKTISGNLSKMQASKSSIDNEM